MVADLSLYLVTDREILGGRDLITAVEEALRGGVTVVQLREKTACSREFYELAVRLRVLTHSYGVPLIINDRLDIALAADADGLHVGTSDLPWDIARRLLGPGKILGCSAETVEDAIEAERCGADYIGAGTVFPTGSKSDVGEPIGTDGLSQIKNSVSIPVVAIGGIGPDNLLEVRQAGVDGISVISAILGQKDIRSATARLKSMWKGK